MELRYYQRLAVNSVWNFIADQEKKSLNPCVVIPTGGGKTPVIATLCSDMVSRWNRRVLVVSHVKELLAQSVDKLEIIAPNLKNDIGLYSAGFDRRDTEQSIVVAGIQSIYNRAELFGKRDLVIVDEAHLIPPDGNGMYQTLFAKLREQSPEMRVCGLTATPFRTGSGPICTPEGILNEICYEIGVQELISGGYLCRVRAKGGKSELDTTGLHVQGGEFAAMDVDFLVNTETQVSSMCDEILEQTKDRHSVLIFAANVSHGSRITGKLRELGAEVEFITGDTPPDERAEILERFRGNTKPGGLFRDIEFKPLKYLVNVNVLTTGYDAPNIDCVVIARPTMSAGLYYQMTGRGLRPCPGKENCLILDFGGNVLRHGPIDLLKPKRCRKGTEAPVKKCPECNEYVPISVQACHVCGYLFFPDRLENDLTYGENGKLSDKASNEAVLSSDITDTVLKVNRVYYSDHEKRFHPEAPHTLEVEYDCGLGASVKEWVCVEHDGFAGSKARKWWKKRSGIPFPESAEEAEYYAKNGGIAEPEEITVRHIPGEKYDRIIAFKLGKIPDWMEPDEEPDEWNAGPSDSNSDASEINASEVAAYGTPANFFNTWEDDNLEWNNLPEGMELPF